MHNLCLCIVNLRAAAPKNAKAHDKENIRPTHLLHQRIEDLEKKDEDVPIACLTFLKLF